MGIKTLNKFLKEKCPEAFKDLPYSYFRGKRVAIDSDNVLRKLMSRAHKEIVNQTDVCVSEPDRKKIVDRWLHHIKEEIIKFLRFGITPVFVFDGSYIDEKSETQNKRREAKKKMIQNAEDEKKKVLKVDELERTPQMVTELRKKMHHLGNIKPEEKEMICEILKSLGFPVLFATEEGEKLCAMLCIEGYIDAVYSRDTDVVAMGCPISFSEEAGWIHNPQTGKSEMAVKCTIFHPILESLKMEYSTFLDLCIMSGCDFNSNIRLIGCVKAYKLLLECKSIDNLPEKIKDKVPILNHIRCREIFGRQSAKTICKSDISIDIDLNVLNNSKNFENFEKYGIQDWVSELKIYYNMFPETNKVFIERPPSYKKSTLKLKVISEDENNVEKNEMNVEKNVIEIPKQKPSPKKLTLTSISNLNSQQLERYRKNEEKNKEEKEVKKVLRLKIVSE